MSRLYHLCSLHDVGHEPSRSPMDSTGQYGWKTSSKVMPIIGRGRKVHRGNTGTANLAPGIKQNMFTKHWRCSRRWARYFHVYFLIKGWESPHLRKRTETEPRQCLNTFYSHGKGQKHRRYKFTHLWHHRDIRENEGVAAGKTIMESHDTIIDSARKGGAGRT